PGMLAIVSVNRASFRGLILLSAALALTLAKRRITGAFQEGYPGFAERGLGRLADREIVVTERGLEQLERHLARFDPDPANAAIVQRLGDALATSGRVRG